MTDLLIYVADRLKGKSLFPLFRWLLNIIFCISISNAIFSKSHPEITLPKTLDYEKIWDFFIQGYFFIPLVIFLIVYFVTQGIVTLFFMYFGDYKNFKLTKRIISYNVEKKELLEGIEGITEISQKFTIVDLTKDKLLEMFNEIKGSVSDADLVKIKEDLEKSKTTISDNFVTLLRGLVAITIYFCTIPSFGYILYILVVLLFIILFIILLIGYKLLDLLPTLIQKAIHIDSIYQSNDNK
jgi:hypothetical protein